MSDSESIQVNQATPRSPQGILMFLLPSLAGVGLFLVPFMVNDVPTVLVAFLANLLNSAIGDNAAYVTSFIFVTAAVVSTVFRFLPLSLVNKTPFLKHVFRTGWTWYALTMIGGTASALTVLGIGPEWIIGKDTGVTAYIDVAIIIFSIVAIGCVLLPLLTEYGLMEFVGTLLRRPFQFLFGLPGRAAIDTLTSWVGSSSIAVVLTAKQYESGYYTAREASVIATNFSVVSIPFVIFIAQVAGIPELFVLLYASMILIGVTCAVITPKLPPLSRVPDEYEAQAGKQISDANEPSGRPLGTALNLAVKRASKAPNPLRAMSEGLKTAFDIAFAMMPAAMTIEFLCLIAYHHTEILQILTFPIIGLLGLMSVPEATATAPGIVIGLLDQFVPAVIASSIENKQASFILAGLSVTQLIFFAESALLIVRSKIPLSVLQLTMIFCVRTVIALPILVLISKLLVSS